MSSTAPQIPGDAIVDGARPAGDGALRIARYSVYPRAERGHGDRAGCTRGARPGVPFTLVTTAPEDVGELLRVHVQELGGRDALDALVRVVACRQLGEGRFELDLEALDARQPRRVRRGAR